MENDLVKSIWYTKETYYIGRNGKRKQRGLGFTHDGDSLLLEPVNSKNYIGACAITIPYEDIPKLMAVLREAIG